MYQKGTAINEILDVYQIDLRLFETWMNNAVYAANRLTHKNNLGLIIDPDQHIYYQVSSRVKRKEIILNASSLK